VTTIVANRVLRVGPDGAITTMLDDSQPEHIAEVEAAYRAGPVGKEQLDAIRSKVFGNVSSLAFAGEDRRTGLFGVLLSDRLPMIRLPFAGAKPVHWEWR
jgi:hypothetical protein